MSGEASSFSSTFLAFPRYFENRGNILSTSDLFPCSPSYLYLPQAWVALISTHVSLLGTKADPSCDELWHSKGNAPVTLYSSSFEPLLHVEVLRKCFLAENLCSLFELQTNEARDGHTLQTAFTVGFPPCLVVGFWGVREREDTFGLFSWSQACYYPSAAWKPEVFPVWIWYWRAFINGNRVARELLAAKDEGGDTESGIRKSLSAYALLWNHQILSLLCFHPIFFSRIGSNSCSMNVFQYENGLDIGSANEKRCLCESI